MLDQRAGVLQIERLFAEASGPVATFLGQTHVCTKDCAAETIGYDDPVARFGLHVWYTPMYSVAMEHALTLTCMCRCVSVPSSNKSSYKF